MAWNIQGKRKVAKEPHTKIQDGQSNSRNEANAKQSEPRAREKMERGEGGMPVRPRARRAAPTKRQSRAPRANRWRPQTRRQTERKEGQKAWQKAWQKAERRERPRTGARERAHTRQLALRSRRSGARARETTRCRGSRPRCPATTAAVAGRDRCASWLGIRWKLEKRERDKQGIPPRTLAREQRRCSIAASPRLLGCAARQRVATSPQTQPTGCRCAPSVCGRLEQSRARHALNQRRTNMLSATTHQSERPQLNAGRNGRNQRRVACCLLQWRGAIKRRFECVHECDLLCARQQMPVRAHA